VIIAITLLMLYVITRRTPRAQQFVSVALAMFWMLSGCWFVYRYYAQINTIANWFLILFVLEVSLLLVFAIHSFKHRPYLPVKDAMLGTGLGIVVYALFVHPVIGVMFGRNWLAGELVGLAPDPTAIATIGFSLALGGSNHRYWLSVIPVLWIVISVITYSSF
jgi:hypothetical protein